jgi:hypothetical protein
MDPMIDPRTDRLDRELARALAVDPSPEFLARVRTRIAEEPAPARFGFRWMFGAAAAAAAVVAAVVMLRPAPQVASQPQGFLASRTIDLTVVVPANDERRTSNVEPRIPNPESRIPVVLFDPREVAALQRLVSRPIAVTAERPAMDLAPVENIVIAPIAIDPLEPGGQGERQ